MISRPRISLPFSLPIAAQPSTNARHRIAFDPDLLAPAVGPPRQALHPSGSRNERLTHPPCGCRRPSADLSYILAQSPRKRPSPRPARIAVLASASSSALFSTVRQTPWSIAMTVQLTATAATRTSLS